MAWALPGAGALGVLSGAWMAPAAEPEAARVPAGDKDSSARSFHDMNTDWRFFRRDVKGAERRDFDDAGWPTVAVPHTWNALDAQDGGSSKATNSGGYYRGVGWYRLHVTPDKALKGRKLWLEFGAAATIADVWVNGKHVGRHSGAFARFRLDVTRDMLPGEDNVIAVKVDNGRHADVPPLSADFPFMGGLYRYVGLLSTDALQIQVMDYGGPGVYARQRSVSADRAVVDVTTKVWNNSAVRRTCRIRTVITDAKDKVVARAESSPQSLKAAAGIDVASQLSFGSPHLWDGARDPYLYRVTSELVDTANDRVTDRVSEPLGLRSVRVDADKGFFLNGRRMRLQGVNAHQDRLDKGWAIGTAEHDEDFALMDEMGVNALRTAHYQQDQYVYTLADRRGYVVWAEVPLVDKVTSSRAFTASSEQQLRELIRQNYNHPSILFWSIGNEQGSDDGATNALLARLAKVVAEEDPDRITTYASHLSDGARVGKHTQTVAFNKYYGWYGGSLTGLGAWADKFRRTQSGRKVGISEYGAGASVKQHQESPRSAKPGSHWHPEEFQATFHETAWKQISERPFLWGSFVWNMFDFASDWRNEGDAPGRNDKGLVTYDRRTRKDAFYFYKANWNKKAHTTHIASSRWTDRTSARTTVKVYSDSENVRLVVNGKSPGMMESKGNGVFTWALTLAPGVNTVEAVGSNGVRDKVVWKLG
ncbi:glycoside hydrolase family 2 TIM barrel-domain containing protein [Streptomyces sp. NPDC029004]|uniref:glycoside hydrolase family 2 protein n=1 Tax=Streptomyces sp. NPDC029004 TaxID=3154490 RepID=UPI00340D9E5C